MLVRTPMTRDVIVASPRLQVAEAWSILQRENIRHLPITEEGKLVGIVSDRDFLMLGRLHTSGDFVFPNQPLAQMMTVNPVTCAPGCTVAEAARIMTNKKIDALPVVAQGRLIGLVTSTDLLLLLLEHPSELSLPFEFRLAEARRAA